MGVLNTLSQLRDDPANATQNFIKNFHDMLDFALATIPYRPAQYILVFFASLLLCYITAHFHVHVLKDGLDAKKYTGDGAQAASKVFAPLKPLRSPVLTRITLGSNCGRFSYVWLSHAEFQREMKKNILQPKKLGNFWSIYILNSVALFSVLLSMVFWANWLK